jgi:hypothetical protein
MGMIGIISKKYYGGQYMNEDFYSFLEEENEKQNKVEEEGLKRLVQLVEQMAQATERVEVHAAQLKASEKALAELKEVAIPDLMRELGIESLDLTGGIKLRLVTKYFASIAKDRAESATDWLQENGHDSIVKSTVTVDFTKGENSLDLVSLLIKLGYNPTWGKTVHPQTLKSWVKEMIEGGRQFPLELFGVHVVTNAVVK